MTSQFRPALGMLAVVLLGLVVYFLLEKVWGLFALSLVLLVFTVYVLAGMKRGTAQAGPVKFQVEFEVDEDEED